MPPTITNLHPSSTIPGPETIQQILAGSAFRLEHITSRADVSPPDFWYDQDSPEWVALLTGSASLEFEDGTLDLTPGDSLLIPAHTKHRVSLTSPDATWLALHFEANS